MRRFDPISLVLIAPLIPMLKALEESKGEPTPKTNFIFGFTGYFVICGVLFNLFAIVAFFMGLIYKTSQGVKNE